MNKPPLEPCPFCSAKFEPAQQPGVWRIAHSNDCWIVNTSPAIDADDFERWNRRSPAQDSVKIPREASKNVTTIRMEVLRCLLEHAINGKALAIDEPENSYIREAEKALASRGVS